MFSVLLFDLRILNFRSVGLTSHKLVNDWIVKAPIFNSSERLILFVVSSELLFSLSLMHLSLYSFDS